MRRLFLPVALGLVSFAGVAHADPKADAARLFDQARALLAEGKTAEACAKLDESMRLAPNGGTLLNLADCFEKNGQTASAYKRFKEAAERANAAGQKKPAASAEARMKALEATLARVTIHVASENASGTKVTLDGEPVPIEEPVPIDPGTHAIVASADGREPATRAVQVPRTAAILEIEMPALRPAAGAPGPPVAPPPKPVDPPPPRDSGSGGGGFSTLQFAGLGLAAAGVVAIGVGAGFGFVAKGKNDDADAQCTNGDPNRCTTSAVALTDDAKSAATLSTVLFIAGGVALVGGAALFILGKDSKATTAIRILERGYRF